MITVGTTVVSGSPINGGGGGGGAPSGTGVVTVTSGVFDTPSTTGAIVNAGVSQLVGSDPAGTAIVSDGAGGIQSTSADVSTLLGAADAAAARAAIGTGAITGGLYSALPASPALGDAYLVSDADPTDPGTLYTCLAAGAWSRLPNGRVATNLWPSVNALHHWRLDDVPGGSAPLTDLGSGAVALTQGGSSWVRGGEATPYGMRQTAAGGSDSLSATIAGGGLTRAAGWSMAATVAAYTGGGPSAFSIVFGAYLAATDYITVRYNSPTTSFYLATAAASTITDGAVSAGSSALNVAHRIVIVATAASNDATLYVDGVATTVTVGGTARATLTTAKILEGANDVEVNNVKIWTSPLTAAQVLQDFRRARVGMAR